MLCRRRIDRDVLLAGSLLRTETPAERIAERGGRDVMYNDIHMWLWRSTKPSRVAWLEVIDVIAALQPQDIIAVAALQPQDIIAGHRDPRAPDNNAVRVLDQSRRYIEDFDAAVAQGSNTTELIDRMMHKYSTHGNPYTLLAAAAWQIRVVNRLGACLFATRVNCRRSVTSLSDPLNQVGG
jgi:hypothetical protein